MALISDPWNQNFDLNSKMVDTYDHVIQGDLIVANFTMQEFDYDGQKALLGHGFDDHVKYELTKLLCEELAKSRRVEFTKSQDVATGAVHFRARIFATPDGMVRVVRELRKNNT